MVIKILNIIIITTPKSIILPISVAQKTQAFKNKPRTIKINTLIGTSTPKAIANKNMAAFKSKNPNNKIKPPNINANENSPSQQEGL